jgi:mRNA interferase MazF
MIVVDRFQWGIFDAHLGGGVGSEQRGRRPVLVVSDEDFNIVMPVVTVLPITSRKAGRHIYPNEVLFPKATAGLSRESIVLAHQIRTISKDRLIKLHGYIEAFHLRSAVTDAISIHLGFGA